MCRDFKTRVLSVRGAAVEEDEPDLVATAEELIVLLRWNVKQLRRKTKEATDYDPDLGRQIQALAKSANGVLDAVRKLQEQGSEVLRAMTLQEKITLIKEFLGELPEMLRERVIADVKKNGQIPTSARLS